MEQDPQILDLAGHLLVAMPGMTDPRFRGAVVLLCSHSEAGAMGIIVNKPSKELRQSTLFEGLKIQMSKGQKDEVVYFGGPVENARGFVLHDLDYGDNGSTLITPAGIGMTASIDILHDIAKGNGPRSALLALGYAGWGAAQLENELAENAWLTLPATREIVFDTPNTRKWSAALTQLGIDPIQLSSVPGRA